MKRQQVVGQQSYDRQIRALVVAASALSVFAASVQAEQRIVRYDDGAGGQLWYRLYLPDDFDPTVAYPVTTFLHGSDGTNIRPVVSPQTDVGRPPPNLVAALASDAYPSILMAPQLERGSWASPDNSRLIREAIDDVQGTFGADPTRRYLTGLSFGGFGTFHFVQEYPNYFAAGVPIAGSYFPPFDPFEPLPEDPFADYAETVKHIPLWVFHGTGDPVVNVNGSRIIVDAVQAAGGNIRYSELPDGNHDIWDRVYDANAFPPSAVFRLDVDTSDQTFAVSVEVDLDQNRGLELYYFDLNGADTIENVAPQADFSPATGTPVGFVVRRSGDNQLPATAQQPDPGDGGIAGLGQTPGSLPGAGSGDGEVQPNYDAPLLIARGTYTDLSALEFSDEFYRANRPSPAARVYSLLDDSRRPFAATFTQIYHDGVLVSSTGDTGDLYPWLFSQRLTVPEPTSWAVCGALAMMCLLDRRMQCGGRRS